MHKGAWFACEAACATGGPPGAAAQMRARALPGRRQPWLTSVVVASLGADGGRGGGQDGIAGGVSAGLLAKHTSKSGAQGTVRRGPGLIAHRYVEVVVADTVADERVGQGAVVARLRFARVVEGGVWNGVGLRSCEGWPAPRRQRRERVPGWLRWKRKGSGRAAWVTSADPPERGRATQPPPLWSSWRAPPHRLGPAAGFGGSRIWRRLLVVRRCRDDHRPARTLQVGNGWAADPRPCAAACDQSMLPFRTDGQADG